MPALLHAFLLTLAVSAAYWWVSVPELNMYSLQAIAAVMILYMVLKRLANAKFWHILPAALSIETTLATFGFLILIGSTGNIGSLLFPLSYIHLFLIAFSSGGLTSLIISVEIALFHYALTPEFASTHLVMLSTLPLAMLFFLFAKRQHEEVVRSRIIIAQETSELETVKSGDGQLTTYVADIQTRLEKANQQLSFPLSSTDVVQQQLSSIQIEVAQLEDYLQKRLTMLTNPDQDQHKPYDSKPN